MDSRIETEEIFVAYLHFSRYARPRHEHVEVADAGVVPNRNTAVEKIEVAELYVARKLAFKVYEIALSEFEGAWREQAADRGDDVGK